MNKQSFPPPSDNKRHGYDLYDDEHEDEKAGSEAKKNVVGALLAGILGHAATIVLYSVLINGLLLIAKESRVIDWELSFVELLSAVFLVQALRIWDRAMNSRRR